MEPAQIRDECSRLINYIEISMLDADPANFAFLLEEGRQLLDLRTSAAEAAARVAAWEAERAQRASRTARPGGQRRVVP